MKVNGEDRTWQDVPYPEKLGLALSVLQEERGDPISTIASHIGLGRLRQATKMELEKLLEEAKRHSKPYRQNQKQGSQPTI
jgi:hypothetical protein